MTAESQLDCPCGLSGADCSQLVAPLANVDGAKNETCVSEGFNTCFITAEEAICVCKCGHHGDFCENRFEPLFSNFGKKLAFNSLFLNYVFY